MKIICNFLCTATFLAFIIGLLAVPLVDSMPAIEAYDLEIDESSEKPETNDFHEHFEMGMILDEELESFEGAFIFINLDDVKSALTNELEGAKYRLETLTWPNSSHPYVITPVGQVRKLDKISKIPLIDMSFLIG